MALTATAQSALPRPWDETIVPALRKRLESESRILAKRMSVASISSADDSLRTHTQDIPRRTDRDAQSSLPEPRRSSAIPRPSLQYPRTQTEPRPDLSSYRTRPSGASTEPPAPPSRARTYSQPPSPNGFTNNPLPTPDSSRPTSPRTSDVKPTRIPIAARTRTTSASSHAHSVAQRAESRNTNGRPYQPPTPDTYQDHWVVKGSDPQPTTPPMAALRHQASSILNEPAPFATPSITSSIRSRMLESAYVDPRPSNDSEERPFEHWYRGDVHRNGGVGELRVAKHVEMLQIANYGHNLRKAARGQTRDLSGRVDSPRGRKRADSAGTGTRESLYLDDEHARDVGMVLDESPLTDIEGDPDTDPETFYDAYAGLDAQPDADDTIHAAVSAPTSGPLPAAVSPSRSPTPTRATPAPEAHTTPKHAVRTVSDPLRSTTSPPPPRASAESNMPASRTSGSGHRSRSMSGTTSPSSDQSHTKRRAKSPAASSQASTPKKAKTKAKTPPPTSRDPRTSVAMYPTPEGDIVNAIPTWTQPVHKSGNWDEVVLPVVARKKGLDGLYEQADGSPKLREETTPVKPAPGTFGFDYTKYRPPRQTEEIQMDEFDETPRHTLPQEDLVSPRTGSLTPTPIPQFVQPDERPIRSDPRQTMPNPPHSPAPFSQYRIQQQVLPTINVTRPSSEFPPEQRHELEDDVAGGCCKCIVM